MNAIHQKINPYYAVMTANKLLLLLLCLDHSNPLFAANVHNATASFLHMTRDHFSRILHTALDDDAALQQVHDDHERAENGHHCHLHGMPSQEVTLTKDDSAWQKLIQHG